MTTTTILIVLLMLILIGAMPTWPYTANRGWGWGPSGILGVLAIILLILVLTGRL